MTPQPKPDKSTTYVLHVVDMSGSMSPLADDVRGGFNAHLDGLCAAGGRYRVTVALFDDRYETLCVAAKLKDVPRLTDRNYQPRGMTALLDAVGRTIAGFEPATVLAEGDRVLLVVQTDGQENASREFRRVQIADMIRQREAGGQWSCMFLGAGIDAWAQARDLGFSRDSTISTVRDGRTTRRTYDSVTQASVAYAAGATAAEASGIVAAAVGTDENTGGAA